jgi:hypothetical protein
MVASIESVRNLTLEAEKAHKPSVKAKPAKTTRLKQPITKTVRDSSQPVSERTPKTYRLEREIGQDNSQPHHQMVTGLR